MNIFRENKDIEYLNEIRKLWNTLKAECGSRWCMPDEYDEDRKLLTIRVLMERLEKRMFNMYTITEEVPRIAEYRWFVSGPEVKAPYKKFNTIEAAKEFCDKMNYKYIVEPFIP